MNGTQRAYLFHQCAYSQFFIPFEALFNSVTTQQTKSTNKTTDSTARKVCKQLQCFLVPIYYRNNKMSDIDDF